MTEPTQLLERPGRSPARATPAPRQVLVITCAGVVLASLDLFIVNVALPQIARDLGASNLGELSWILNGYAIVYASLLIFFGRLADRYRRDPPFSSALRSSLQRRPRVHPLRAWACSSASASSRRPGRPY